MFGVIIKAHRLKVNPSGFTVSYLEPSSGTAHSPSDLVIPIPTCVINSREFASI